MLSRHPDVLYGSFEDTKPLLRLATMEACQLIWINAQNLEHIKIATARDTTHKPILAFFINDLNHEPSHIRWQFHDYTFNNGVIYF